MKKQHTEKIVSYNPHNLLADKTDWKRVDAMSDKELQDNARSDNDTMLIDKNFWKKAKVVMPATAGKERITIRVDADVLHWLKDQGHGYQSRINSILRSFMIAMK